MKKLYLLLCFVPFTFIAHAQNPVPNSSFESWNVTAPTSWDNSYAPISQVTPGHTGTYAVKIGPHGQLTAGMGSGFPISQAYGYLNFWYKFNRIANEEIRISAEVDDANYNAIGTAALNEPGPASQFQFISIPVTYTGTGPAHCFVDMFLTINQGNTIPDSSYFIIDDVSLTAFPVGIAPVQKQTLSLQVFPNPATGTVHINLNTSEPKTNTVQITDITGRVIKEMNTADTDITLDIANLPSGNYIVVVKNDEMLQTKRLVIL